jgi:hypothetical protein
MPTGERRHESLRVLFGADAFILDLEDEPETFDDIARYALSRLTEFRPKDEPARLKIVANDIARKADGIFLYARIVCRTLRDPEQRLDIDLPADALTAFVADLTLRFGEKSAMVNDILAALAWCEGKGLTRRAWARVAGALSTSGAHYNKEDVAWVLSHAGWYILEAGEEGQSSLSPRSPRIR